MQTLWNVQNTSTFFALHIGTNLWRTFITIHKLSRAVQYCNLQKCVSLQTYSIKSIVHSKVRMCLFCLRSILFYKTAVCNLGLPLADSAPRRKIRLIEGNARCRHLKILTCKGTLRHVFICLRPRTQYHPPLHTVYVYTYSILIRTGKGERVEPERRGEGQ